MTQLKPAKGGQNKLQVGVTSFTDYPLSKVIFLISADRRTACEKVHTRWRTWREDDPGYGSGPEVEDLEQVLVEVGVP